MVFSHPAAAKPVILGNIIIILWERKKPHLPHIHAPTAAGFSLDPAPERGTRGRRLSYQPAFSLIFSLSFPPPFICTYMKCLHSPE